MSSADIRTREADVYPSLTLMANDSALSLARCMPTRYYGFAELIQADDGPEFKVEFTECPGWTRGKPE